MAPLKIVLSISLLLLPHSLSATGFASYDEQLGICMVSPFSPPYLAIASFTPIVETGVTNHYSAELTSNERYLSTYWGYQWGKERHQFTATLTYFTAFSLLQELTPLVGYAFRLTPRLTLGGTWSYTIHWADTLHQSSSSPSLGIAWQWEKLSLAVDGTWGELEMGQEQSIDLEGEIRCMLRAKENLLGSQGVGLTWDFTQETFVFTVVESFSLATWWKISLGIASSPMTINLGSAWEVKRSLFGVLMSHHPDLGWSSSLNFQWRINRLDTSASPL